MIFPKIVAGDYEGDVEIKIGFLWSGPKASKYKGFRVAPGVTYAPDDLARIVHLNEKSATSFISGAARGVAGAVLLGGVGAIAGVLSVSGKAKIVHYGVELTDGKKFIMASAPTSKILLCMLVYAKESGIYEHDLGF